MVLRKIADLLLRIIRAGGGDLHSHERRFIINTNVYSLIIMSLTLPYPMIYYQLGLVDSILIPLGSTIWILFYSFVILLNWVGWHKTAKVVFFFNGIGQLAVISLFFGEKAGLDQFFFGALVLPFFMVNRREKFFMVSSITVLLLEYIAIKIAYHYIPPVVRIEPDTANIIYHITTGAVFLMLLSQSLYFYVSTIRAEDVAQREKALADQLLLNILPEPIANELKRQGRVTPTEFESVTVVFTDFVGFTASAEKLTPAELLAELDECFSAFDAIIEKYGLEKLKTIGDAYMYAGGIPRRNYDHAVKCIKAALEILHYVSERQKKKNSPAGSWEIRIGAHTGSLVAGVIGRRKFIYDVWGDTVNTASRLESAGEPGSINVSQETAELIRHVFPCEFRGEIPVKGKRPLPMYRVRLAE